MRGGFGGGATAAGLPHPSQRGASGWLLRPHSGHAVLGAVRSTDPYRRPPSPPLILLIRCTHAIRERVPPRRRLLVHALLQMAGPARADAPDPPRRGRRQEGAARARDRGEGAR